MPDKFADERLRLACLEEKIEACIPAFNKMVDYLETLPPREALEFVQRTFTKDEQDLFFWTLRLINGQEDDAATN